MSGPTVRRARLAAAVLCGVALSACGTNNSSTAASPQSDPMSGMSMSPDSSMGGADTTGMSSMIMIQDFSFSGPAPVKPGSTVTVMNEDTETHTVTADGDSFDITVPAGATETFTAPDKPGSYPFHCSFHSDMHGTLRVR